MVVSYRLAASYVQGEIDLEMQLAQEKLRFELYDAYEVTSRLKDFIEDEMKRPEDLLEETHAILKYYPQIFTCYFAFSEYHYPNKGKWYCPSSYRVRDSLYTIEFGDAEHDYFTREWYQGAVASVKTGFWSHPYRDEDFDETIFTYAEGLRDKNGSLIGVAACDFSVAWVQQLLDQYRPFDEAVFVLYSSDGEKLAVSGKKSDVRFGREWLVSRKTLEPINIDFVMAVPRSYIWASIRWGIWLPFAVFLLGILVVGVFLRRLRKEHLENARLELMEHDMQIAHNIQMGILKNRKEKDKEEKKPDGEQDLELHAILLPMREVGGDLYDFHREGDTLWFIIGDVSGKGVPAAMFMSAAVNLFRAAGIRAHSPREIVEEMNAVLSENNPSLIFVTAFVGRFHIPSGELLYCNAGHCAPIHVPFGHLPCTILDCEPNIPLGYDGNYRFVEQGCMLNEGDKLVLYTDGVTEARNSERQMLGLQRWSDIVMTQEDLPAAIRQYIGNAEPTDDITLMTIRKLSPVQPVTMCVPNKEDQLPLLRRTIHEYGICSGIETHTLKKLEVATEETLVNILRYSQATDIELAISCQSSAISIQISDNGTVFDPTAYETNTDAVTERQIGGMGIGLIRQIVDEMRYQRIGNTNQLTLIKHI